MWLGIYLSTDEIIGQVVDEELNTVCLRRRPIMTYTPKSGYAEQDPEEWWTALLAVVREIKRELKDQDIKAASVSSQREGLVFVNEEGKPIGRCIIWMDTRAWQEAEYIKHRIGKDVIYKLTGLPIDATFSFPRLLWIRQNSPQTLRRTKYYLQPKDYIIYKLTGKFLTDSSLACRTILYDIRKFEWIEEFFKEFQIPNLFPPIVKSTDIVGYLEDELADKIGLKKGIPVIAGGGDRPVQMVAAGGEKTGEFFEHMGSVVNLSTTLDNPKFFVDSKIGVSIHVLKGKWLAESSVSAGELIFNWLLELLNIDREELNLIDYNVSQIPPACEGLLIVPHLQGARAPWWVAHNKGTIYDLTLKHSKWHIVRAFMESVAYEIKFVLDMFKESGIIPTNIICLENIERYKSWHIIKSACINFPLTFTVLEEPTSYGAALLSILGTGRKDLIEHRVKNRIENTIEPPKELVRVYAKTSARYLKAVKNATKYYRQGTS